MCVNLERVQDQEGHHETEQTHGLGQSEAENGVREQLLLQRRVTRVTDDQTAEHRADTGARTGHTDRGRTGTDELRRTVNVSSDQAGLQRTNRLDLVVRLVLQDALLVGQSAQWTSKCSRLELLESEASSEASSEANRRGKCAVT